jgi:membrane peptidoglycan carboxypeptidase
MKGGPAALRRTVAGGVVLLALLLSSFATMWIWTPSVDDIQQRVAARTDQLGVVLLSPGQVPALLAEAVVATEDERFYKHHGIDSIGLGRALLYDATNLCLCQGGSTITQQLMKDIYLGGSDRGYDKLTDMVLALKVERVIGKGQIMADYLSVITTGLNRYGVAAAACAYFQAPLARLTLAQYALLAGLTQAPSIYDPTVNPDAAASRRAQVLAKMAADDLISAQQAAQAGAEPVLDRSGPGC